MGCKPSKKGKKGRGEDVLSALEGNGRTGRHPAPATKGGAAEDWLRLKLVWARQDDFYDNYKVLEEIGSGSMGSVSIVERLPSAQRSSRRNSGAVGSPPSPSRSGRRFAMKTILVNRVSKELREELLNEISILRRLDHPNVIQLHEVFYNKRSIFLVMELCHGGSLGSRELTERQTCLSIIQILRALSYVHENGVIHRDLKLENALFATDATDSIVKLIDFGLSETFTRGEKMRQACGTVYTMAPELLGGQGYTQQADCWSVGIMAYALLSGTVPFLTTEADLADERKKNRLLQARFQFISERWNEVTAESRHFIGGLLRRRPESRWTAREALDFAVRQWMPAVEKRYPEEAAAAEERASVGPATEHEAAEEEEEGKGEATVDSWRAVRKRVSSDIVASMNRFAGYGEFKRAALMVLAFNMDKSGLLDLTNAFTALDKERNGVISLDELRSGLQRTGMPAAQVERVFGALDQDRSGRLHYMEFLAATLEARGFLEEERLAEAFDRLDADETGHISVENLRELLGNSFDEATVQTMIREVDRKGDGVIDYEEFLDIMRPHIEETHSADVVMTMAEEAGLTPMARPQPMEAVTTTGDVERPSMADLAGPSMPPSPHPE